jgi:hypothetical protein
MIKTSTHVVRLISEVGQTASGRLPSAVLDPAPGTPQIVISAH